MNRNHFLICACNSAEHTLRFMYDKEHDEIYTEVYLNQYNSFLTRLVIAIKYIFGYTSKYGHFDCTIMTKDSAKKLNFFLKDFLK